jgi:thiol-disulfide isomerase/thioredoxin
MLALHAAVVWAACSVGETALLDFSADWCGPCRQMEPVVAQLASLGYPVRKVNIDHEPALAARYGVQPIPCFVLVVDGREVERTVGATTFEKLQGMLQKHGVAAATATPKSPRPEKKEQVQPAAVSPDMAAQLLAASVRLKISEANGHSYGSGTMIDVRGNEALIVTCGHIFRDSQGQGKVTIDLFGSGAPRGLPGHVIGYDLKSDVGLVSFNPGCPVRTAALAAPSYQVRRGDAVINIGCNNGAEPTVKSSRVTSLDKFLGPPNIQVAGQPVQGRSGGGLFTDDGRVIGICNAADPADNEGLYAALPSIWALLEQHKWMPELASDRAAVAGQPRAEPTLLAATVPVMPQRMPATTTSATATGSIDREQNAALATLAAQAPAAELICIIRTPNNPQSAGELIVLDKAPPELIERLAAERLAQRDRQLALAQRTDTPAPLSSSRGNVVRNTPVVNVRGGNPPAATWRPNWLRPQ